MFCRRLQPQEEHRISCMNVTENVNVLIGSIHTAT